MIYPLDEMLLLCLLAVLAGAETFADIALFGARSSTFCAASVRSRTARRRTTISATSSPRSTPSSSNAASSPGSPRMTGVPEGVIAIDGKTVRRSGRKKGGKPAIHMVSAFAARQRLVLGQVKVAEKSNEIIAIPKLLDMLAIEGAIVTIDAMGCQRDIAQKIVDKKADYVLALKGNQGSLREDVEMFVAEQKAAGFKDTKISRDQTVDGDHGRIETRTTTVIHDVAWLQERHNWPGLKAVVMVESSRETDGKIEHGDTLLHHLAGAAGAPARADRPQPLGNREQPPLGHGHDVPRRRVPGPNRPRTRQLHHHQAHGAQPDPNGARQGLIAPQAQGRRLG